MHAFAEKEKRKQGGKSPSPTTTTIDSNGKQKQPVHITNGHQNQQTNLSELTGTLESRKDTLLSPGVHKMLDFGSEIGDFYDESNDSSAVCSSTPRKEMQDRVSAHSMRYILKSVAFVLLCIHVFCWYLVVL